jgi:transposase
MIPVPSGVRVWIAVGRTDMRRGMNGLALQVQETLGRDPFAGDEKPRRRRVVCRDLRSRSGVSGSY